MINFSVESHVLVVMKKLIIGIETGLAVKTLLSPICGLTKITQNLEKILTIKKKIVS
jgi:hypothetical protein